MRNRIETIEVEADLMWTAAIMGSLAILETHGGAKFEALQEMREKEGIGGDSMTAGFLRLAIAAGKHLDARIDTYDSGVFAYEHLETSEGELPWLFIEQLTPAEWASICNWNVPQDEIEAIIDAWLEGPRFATHRTDGTLELTTKVAEHRQFEVDLRGFIMVSRKVTVTAANTLLAANDALSNISRLPEGWNIIGEAVTESFAGDVSEVASA